MVGRRLNRGRLAGPSSQGSAARARGNVMSAIPPSMPPAACMPTRLRTTHQPPSGSGRSAERGINEDREQRDRCRELRNPLNLVLLSLVFRSSNRSLTYDHLSHHAHVAAATAPLINRVVTRHPPVRAARSSVIVERAMRTGVS
jgi:hypothetical protein